MLFMAGPYPARLITADDAFLLQDLFVRCTDFSLLVEGVPPGPNAAQDLLHDVAPGKTLDDKILIGLWDSSGCLLGLIDAMRGYPAPDQWFIGLMLIDPALRGQGIGAQAYRGFEHWAAGQGAHSIGLGVVEANTAGCRFWQQMGFAEASRTEPRSFGEKTHVVIRMQKFISASLR
jgi:GNAT superfamily N-acetyltransferase